MVGTTVSHYRVLELLGRGGMGEVYAAEDLRLRRRVALKVLPPEMAENPERRRRFEREAQAVASLSHPSIVTIYSVEQEGNTSFLTMELVEGQTLDQVIPEGGLPLADFLQIAIPLADAVDAAHTQGILHRDLKPANVMLTKDGRIKVLDFGLAKLADEQPAAALNMQAPLTTSSGQIVGTLSYMAPEQAEGRRVDRRADIFGIGVLLYELAAGMRPFSGESNVALLTSLLRDTPRPITEMRSDLPAALAPIIDRCLEKEPSKRYQSAAELRADLEALRSEAAAARNRPRSWTYSAAAAAAMIVGLVAWWSLRSPAQSAAATALDTTAVEMPVLITGRKVAILDFANRTGDPALEAFGRMVGEAMAAGLASEGVPVVTATEASAADGLTIAGSYVIDGGDVRFDGRLLAASRGSVLRVLEPVRGPRSSLLIAADSVRHRIMPVVLASFDAQQ
jgi:tRNA A-37 threonylcarbamoyl transferase component Bud32